MQMRGDGERQRKEALALGRAGTVLSEVFSGNLLGTQPRCCQAAQLPCLLTALLGIILLMYPLLGAIFHLDLPMKMSCCGVLLGQCACPGHVRGFPPWAAAGPGLQLVSVVCSVCALALGAGDS